MRVWRKDGWGGIRFNQVYKNHFLYDWQVCGAVRDYLCLGTFPNRAGPIHPHSTSTAPFDQYDKVMVSVYMWIRSEVQYGPFASASGFLSLTHLGVDLDTY